MRSINMWEEVERRIALHQDVSVVRPSGRAPFIVENEARIGIEAVPWAGKAVDRFDVPCPTDVELYRRQLRQLISDLQKRGGGKTVLSRIIGVNIDFSKNSLRNLALNLWDAYPETFGFFVYRPNAGLWIGASPELLFSVDKQGRFETQALAGTIPVGRSWDEKNIEEQQLVADYIKNVLTRHGLEHTIHGPEETAYGNIKHLSTRFSGELPKGLIIGDFLKELAPTPALSGYPKETALRDIEKYESHSRNLYGGYITLSDENGIASYVVIRCVHIDVDSGRAAIYVGGGITSKSDVDAEEEETRQKAFSVINAMKIV